MVHPLKFIKLKKSPLGILRLKRCTVSTKICDIITEHSVFERYLSTVRKTIKLTQSLGFMIPQKATYIPSKKVDYLGFIIEPGKMIMYLTD